MGRQYTFTYNPNHFKKTIPNTYLFLREPPNSNLLILKFSCIFNILEITLKITLKKPKKMLCGGTSDISKEAHPELQAAIDGLNAELCEKAGLAAGTKLTVVAHSS